ncbi:MAG: glycosyltransferase [Clostridiales bacterium]|nr:glycosyltransferase [Clostridiales bacterium]
MPLISVIVPVYNAEKTLEYCIRSILEQTFEDFELLLIDDGSKDRSAEICDAFAEKDNRITVIRKENGGVSSARNTGIKNASGKYICFADSDDYISNKYLQALIDAKNKYSNSDNIWCGFQTVDGYDNPRINHTAIFDDNVPVSVLSRDRIMTIHEKWLDSGPYCKLYSKSIIEDNNLLFPQDLSLGEDLVFNFEYLDRTNGKIVIINQPLYNYVFCNGSLSNRYYSNMFEIYKRINSVMHSCVKKWNCDASEVSKLYNACFFKYEVVLRNTFCKESKIKNKVKYNKEILKSEEFTTAFENSNCYIHPIYRFAYKHRLSLVLRLMYKVL